MRASLVLALAMGCSARVHAGTADASCESAPMTIDASPVVDADAKATPVRPGAIAPDWCQRQIPAALGGECGARCDLVARLDYESRTLLGYRVFCGPDRAPLRPVDAERMVEGYLGIDTTPRATMVGFDHAVEQPTNGAAASGDDGVGFPAGGVAMVDSELARVVFAASVDRTVSGGEILFPRFFHPRPSPMLACSQRPKDVPPVTAVLPAAGPSFGPDLATPAVRAAWDNVLGWYLESTAPPGFAPRAYALRWAPTEGGTFRDWIVVVRLGRRCCPGEC